MILSMKSWRVERSRNKHLTLNSPTTLGSSSSLSYFPRCSLKVLQKSVRPMNSFTFSSSLSYTCTNRTRQTHWCEDLLCQRHHTHLQHVVTFIQVRAALVTLSDRCIKLAPPIHRLLLLSHKHTHIIWCSRYRKITAMMWKPTHLLLLLKTSPASHMKQKTIHTRYTRC